jgi:hypothetical protein
MIGLVHMALISFSTILPQTHVSKVASLLHSPERWSRGECVLLGIPSFKIVNIDGPFSLAGEHIVEFTAQTYKQQRVVVKCSQENDVRIDISNMWAEMPHTQIHTILIGLPENNTMVSLGLNTDSEASEWLLSLREVLCLTLQNMHDVSEAMELSEFERFRLALRPLSPP